MAEKSHAENPGEQAFLAVGQIIRAGRYVFEMLRGLRQGEVTMHTLIVDEHIYFLHSHQNPNRIEIEEIGSAVKVAGRLRTALRIISALFVCIFRPR